MNKKKKDTVENNKHFGRRTYDHTISKQDNKSKSDNVLLNFDDFVNDVFRKDNPYV